MKKARFLILMCFMLMLMAIPWGVNQAGAAPASPTDETKVPHYYGPWPNWALSPSMQKFIDPLPGLCDPTANGTGCPAVGKYIPLGVPDTTTYGATATAPAADYYEIGLVQYRQQMHSTLPAPLLRGYVQLSTTVVPGGLVALSNATLAGGTVPIAGYTGVTPPQYLGPIIAATKDKPVRILFRNLLPTGQGGDLFMPVDTTLMGSGKTEITDPPNLNTVMDLVRNPACTESPKGAGCFADNRATLHLHGGVTPWISDGTPHQWITPAGEDQTYGKGDSVSYVPDMWFDAGGNTITACAGQLTCATPGATNNPGPGAMTFYYTNQQSARLMFYHDHAWGITRLNVYAGEAAGYLITDDTEKALITAGTIPGAADTIPLVIQDRTFVPSAAQLYGDTPNGIYGQDPTWDAARWGGEGNLWYHHVYMPAQNPWDMSGMSGYGRWMYGPYFWPPATAKYPPIPNPYYNPACFVDDPTSWQYLTDPFCEPEFIPSTPNISAGMEQFNDTPIVNGTAYPTVTLPAKPYRLRILNAANDRFFNLQWYVADATGTEVALKAVEVAAAQLDPVVFPTPDTALSPEGPAWVQIGSEGGFLPAPTVINNQPTTWITDPTRFDVGNVDLHSLLLAPAERADVIVDLTPFAGKTLILYNDAPAAFPARVPSYDYYTGYPDQSPVGPAAVLPGFGPNTRTIMQVVVTGTPGAATPNYVNPTILTNLQNAFKHNAGGTGVFESGQHPIIVGQAAYNSAYFDAAAPILGKFAANSYCNAPGSTQQRCDGLARIFDMGGDMFGFNTLGFPATNKLQIPLQPKAIHDEMNSSTFDEFGRMQANLGLEKVPPTAGGQNVALMPYTSPPTEIIDATGLPKPALGVNVTPITTATDGTQIWKITHNGVDTHPIHFHLYDVQLLNRVTWDNIIIPPEPGELGWKETVRISPLEDTIVALRPVIPTLPFDLPNSIRYLSPAMAPNDLILGAAAGAVDPNGTGVDIFNNLVNFGWEYVYHCHILSHEEMDMMRPVSVAIPPVTPTALAGTRITGAGRVVNLTWTDTSRSETAFEVQRNTNNAGFVTIATLASFPPGPTATLPPTQGPGTGPIAYSDTTVANDTDTLSYQVRAINVVGDTATAGFPTMTAVSAYTAPVVPTVPAAPVPNAPTNLTATMAAGPLRVQLSWTDASNNETQFAVWRQVNGAGAFTQIGTVNRTLAQSTATGGNVTFTNLSIGANNVVAGNTYTYYVTAVNASGPSLESNQASVSLLLPAAPTNLAGSAVRITGNFTQDRATLTWTDNANNETGFQVQRSTSANFTNPSTFTVGANVTTLIQNVNRVFDYYYRVRAVNAVGNSAWSNTRFVTTP